MHYDFFSILHLRTRNIYRRGESLSVLGSLTPSPRYLWKGNICPIIFQYPIYIR